MSKKERQQLDVRTFLQQQAKVSSDTIQIITEDQGFVDMDDLLSLGEEDISQLAAISGISLLDKARLLRALRAFRHLLAQVSPQPTLTPLQTATHIALIIEAASPLALGKIMTAVADLEYSPNFSRNIRELLTLPAERSSGAITFFGAPFRPHVVRNSDGTYASLCVNVCEEDKNATLRMRIVGATEDHQRLRTFPSDFDHTTLFDHTRMHVHIEENAAMPQCSAGSAELRLFLVQLLGGTNKAISKLDMDVVVKQVNRMGKAIVMNDGDAMLEKVKEFVEPLAQAKSFHAVVHRGALLWGPAGGAKTTIARMIAECGFVVPFDGNLVALGNEYQNSASKGIINLFAFARHFRHVPTLLVCDEFDRVVQKRDQFSSKKGGGGNEQENALSMLLALITDPKNDNIFIVGTTNKYHAIDEAAIRPGRVGLHIFVGCLSPSAAKVFIAQLFRDEGFDAIADDLRGMNTDPRFVRMIFNMTGAFLAQAVKATIYIDRPVVGSRWTDVVALLDQRISELRNPAIDPSSLLLTAAKQHLTLTGAAVHVRRAMLREVVAPTSRVGILRSTFLLNSAEGVGFVAGNNHAFHVPLNLREGGHGGPQTLRHAAVFSDVVGTVCAAMDAVSVEVVRQSTLPEGDEIPAFAHQQGKMGEAGLRVIAIHVDDIVGVNVEESTSTSRGLTMGTEKNYSLAKGETRTESHGLSHGLDRGYGTDWSQTATNTSGTSSTKGTSTQKGLFWDTDSDNSSTTVSHDVSTGNSNGFNRHASWSETKTKDVSHAFDVTETVGRSENTNESRETGTTETFSLEDPMVFRRVINVIQQLQHTPNVLVAVISSRQDTFLMKRIVRELAIEPPMVCSICHSRTHDPTRLLMGLQAVPCCTYCFDSASHNVGIDFDDGTAFRRVQDVLQEAQPILPIIEAVECCAVEGLLNTLAHSTVVRTLARELPVHCPHVQRFVFHGFGDYMPSLPQCETLRIPSKQLVTHERGKLTKHLQLVRRNLPDAEALTATGAHVPRQISPQTHFTASSRDVPQSHPTASSRPKQSAQQASHHSPTIPALSTNALWSVFALSRLVSTVGSTGLLGTLARFDVGALLSHFPLPSYASVGTTMDDLRQKIAAHTSKEEWASAMRTTSRFTCGNCFQSSSLRGYSVEVEPDGSSTLSTRLSKSIAAQMACPSCKKTSVDSAIMLRQPYPKVLVITVIRRSNSPSRLPYSADITMEGASWHLLGVVNALGHYVNVTNAITGWKKIVETSSGVELKSTSDDIFDANTVTSLLFESNN